MNLQELVRDEADKLKRYATKEELARLDFKRLKPYDYTYCIYGQLGGDCYSKRAMELLNLCARPLSKTNNFISGGRKPVRFVNRITRWYSPIEVYISQKSAKNENLIAYLRGEVETLEL